MPAIRNLLPSYFYPRPQGTRLGGMGACQGVGASDAVCRSYVLATVPLISAAENSLAEKYLLWYVLCIGEA